MFWELHETFSNGLATFLTISHKVGEEALCFFFLKYPMREREREPDEPIVSSLLCMPLHSRLNRSLDFRSLFSSSSQWVPNMLPKFPIVFPQHVLHSTSLFISYALAIVVLLSKTYIRGPKARNSILQNRAFYFGEPP
jgi:hypothetical protein